MTSYTNLAFIRAQPDKTQALGHALLALVAPSRAEPGCGTYDVHRSNDDADMWMVYETWRSVADLEVHFTLPHMQDFVAKIPELVAGDLDLRAFTRMSDPA